MHDWQVNNWRTCARQVVIRAMPENEIPRVLRGDYYLRIKFGRKRKNKYMRKIKDNAMGKTAEERESCFSEHATERTRPEGGKQ